MTNPSATPGPLRGRSYLLLDNSAWVFVAAFMALAGIDKLFHYPGFVNAINDYRILPIPLGKYLAPVLISLELGVGAGLCRRSWRRSAARLSTLLLVILTIAWSANKALGARGICGCWFSINMGNDRVHLILNITLIFLSLLIWYGEADRPLALDSTSERVLRRRPLD